MCIVLMCMHKEEFHHHFSFNLRQLMLIKTADLPLKTNIIIHFFHNLS